MPDNIQKPADDFFALLAKEDNTEVQSPVADIADPFAKDEIVFKDEAGQLKTLKAGQVQVLSTPPVQPVANKTAPAPKPLNLDQEVESIVAKSKIDFPDPVLKTRFAGIIRSRLKGIRDQVQTREILLSSPLLGGLGLPEQKTDQVLQIINQESQELDERLRATVSQEPFAELKAEVSQILQEPSSVEPPNLVFNQSPVTAEPVVETGMAKKPERVLVTPVVRPTVKFVDPQAAKPSIQRPKIEDVKFRPRLTGPIEEIHSLTLTDFRRLSPQPDQAGENILEKIKLLEPDSFSDLVAGVKAWQQSEVNQLYLDIGHQSMAEKMPVAQVIKQRQAAQQPTLTDEEFEAIADLNQKLRY